MAWLHKFILNVKKIPPPLAIASRPLLIKEGTSTTHNVTKVQYSFLNKECDFLKIKKAVRFDGQMCQHQEIGLLFLKKDTNRFFKASHTE